MNRAQSKDSESSAEQVRMNRARGNNGEAIAQ